MNMLAAFEPREQTNIAAVLHDVATQIRRKGIVILISDLFDDEEKILRGIQHLRFSGSEVIVFHTMDPFELEFPFAGMVEFDGLENPGKVPLTLIEVQSGPYLGEDDIVRFDDVYGRTAGS